MKAFVSHITEEAATAQALKRELERALPGMRVFAGDISIVLTHGQDKWNRSRSSPFEFPAALRAARAARWSFRPIRQQDDLLSGQLHTLTRDQRGGS